MTHPVTANKISQITKSLDLLARTGTKSMTLSVDLTWFEHFMSVLGVHHFSVGTYSHGGRFLQTHGGDALTYKGMRLVINTNDVPEGIPANAREGYMQSWICPDCGELDTVYGSTGAFVTLYAAMYGGVPIEVI
jgi:hypothetical protein